MIDIPLNKALEAVEGKPGACGGCCFRDIGCSDLACYPDVREDGKNVIFKLIDLPKKNIR